MALKINDNGIDRDMTADEEAAYLAYQKIATAEAKKIADALKTKQVARQAVLDKLNLTADEAAALLG
jgi:hypothetical protein